MEFPPRAAQQLTAAFDSTPASAPTDRDLWEYILELYDEIARETPKFVPSPTSSR